MPSLAYDDAVSLRTRQPEMPKRPMSIRLADDLRAYLRKVAERDGVDMTRVIEDAIALDRDIAARLEPRAAELQAFARDRELDINTQLARVLADLVEAGLDAQKRPTKK